MPELPEIETIKRQLRPCVQGKEIVNLHVSSPALTRSSQVPGVERGVVHALILEVKRHGKYLLWELSNGHTLVAHLRLTGQLHFYKQPPTDHRHEVARFVFDDDSCLIFADARRFATLQLMPTEDVDDYLGLRAGVDCMDPDFTKEYFWGWVHKSRRPLKSFLLDQKHFAGIGNIYADEALYQAKLRPLRVAKTITREESNRLHAAVVDRLRAGISSGGASVSDYEQVTGAKGSMQKELRAYGRRGKPCLVCGLPMVWVRVSGRGTTYCPRCQPPR